MNWRIGAVSYLNTKPLIYGLREHLPESELVLDLPSRLADRLSAGELDVALIPSVEFLRGEGLEIVSDACIACRGPVRSVRVLFRKPPSEVKTLALDEGSRTSAALAQVLLAERFGVRPVRQQLDINAVIDDCSADAILVIGDRAMSLDVSSYCDSWDLGEEWVRETGLPFVFAMWVSRGHVSPIISAALEQARDSGLANLDEIVAKEAPRYGLSSSSCEEYFRRHLHFCLGERERAGLSLFSRHADSLGLTSKNRDHFSVHLSANDFQQTTLL
jgi:chorismate dehydratase